MNPNQEKQVVNPNPEGSGPNVKPEGNDNPNQEVPVVNNNPNNQEVPVVNNENPNNQENPVVNPNQGVPGVINIIKPPEVPSVIAPIDFQKRYEEKVAPILKELISSAGKDRPIMPLRDEVGNYLAIQVEKEYAEETFHNTFLKIRHCYMSADFFNLDHSGKRTCFPDPYYVDLNMYPESVYSTFDEFRIDQVYNLASIDEVIFAKNFIISDEGYE